MEVCISISIYHVFSLLLDLSSTTSKRIGGFQNDQAASTQEKESELLTEKSSSKTEMVQIGVSLPH